MLKHLIITLLIIRTIKAQEKCNFNKTMDGECLRIEKCAYALRDYKGITIKTCGFENRHLLFCCPKEKITSRSTEYGKIAKEKCEEIKNNYDIRNKLEKTGCGYSAGYTHAKSADYIHMAALGYGDYNEVQWLCGGSLISEKFILTAAHCLGNKNYGKVRWVRLGELDLYSTKDEAEPLDFAVKTLIKHPDYKPPSKYNDIGLIELESSVIYSRYIKPACIETNEEFKADILHATGWGVVDADERRDSFLQDVELIKYTHEECRNLYNGNIKRSLKDGIIKSQMCAGGRGEIKDTCIGDSGGPLQYKNEACRAGRLLAFGYKIVGITSFGKSKICGISRSPGVYTKVSAFVPWIESIVWPSD